MAFMKHLTRINSDDRLKVCALSVSLEIGVYLSTLSCFGKYINESIYTVIYQLISDLVSYQLQGIALQLPALHQARSLDQLGRCTPVDKS